MYIFYDDKPQQQRMSDVFHLLLLLTHCIHCTAAAGDDVHGHGWPCCVYVIMKSKI